MEDSKKTREQLLRDLKELRRKAAECEEAQKQEKAVEETLRLYERIVSLSYDRLAFIDNHYIYRAANDSYIKHIGKPREKIIGYSMRDVLGDEFFGKNMKYYLDKCLSGETVNFQSWNDVHGLGNRYHNIYFFPYWENKETVGGIVISVRDITEHQMAEEARVKQAASQARADELQRSRQRIVNVQESLRKEIAHILHGTIQNKLIVLMHQLNELENTAAKADVKAGLHLLHDRLARVLDEDIRSVSHRLYPSIVHQGLIPGIESLADHFESVLTIELKIDENLEQLERKNRQLIPEVSRLAFYRITEEALTNILKHANATKVFIDLYLSSDNILKLTIRDNGKGFSPGAKTCGLGMSIMQDYAEMMGGSFEVSSKPGKGTEVKATLGLDIPGTGNPAKTPPSE
jgi:PAS domain S-box-containing protein